MFGRKKNKEDTVKEKEKLLRRALGKDSGRRVFGFQCMPELKATMKSLADQMHVPLFALCEHAIELGEMQIEDAIKDPEERELLRSHLVDFHVAPRTIEKIAVYDEQAASNLKIERIRRLNIEKATRRLVTKFVSSGFKPEDLEGLIVFGYRCQIAITRGWPEPPDVSSRRNGQQPPDSTKKQNPEETENNEKEEDH